MNKWLHGNGGVCPQCGGGGQVPDDRMRLFPCYTPGEQYATSATFGYGTKPCSTCRGDGRIAALPEQIVAQR